MDADRDQHEVVISSADQFACLTPMEDGRVSSTSISINLDRSRDSLLDQSVCSNPRDETSLLEQLQAETTIKMSDKRPNISDDALPPFPPPPPPIDEHSRSGNGSTSTPHTLESSTTSAASTTKSVLSDQEETRRETETKTTREIPVRSPAGTERISSFVHGYGGRLGFLSQRPDYEQPKSPLLWSSSRTSDGRTTEPKDEANKENAESQRAENRYGETSYTSSLDPRSRIELSQPSPGSLYSYEQKQSMKRHSSSTERPIDIDVDLERSMKRFARYGQIYADSPLSYVPNVETYEMQLPPVEPPPLPPPVGSRGYTEPTGYRTSSRDTSRDDLMSEGHRSRSTIREIPINRSSSAFGPSITAPPMPYDFQRAPSAGGAYHRYVDSTGAPAEEYYRREVMTRTLITRSNDALSAPPLSRSSPVDALRHLPLPEPRDDVSVEYTYKYSRNLEEEERRIRENQEKRHRDEEERRRREEENRRIWEQREMELLEKLRRDREKMETELEQQIRDRERLERDRIEKDRIEREKIEMRRRQEWERLEDERRALEEAELIKRRELERLEKERLEREKLEQERREMERLERERRERERVEAERLERERIERERIEIERLEIERIERIKREQVERQRLEKEREREEAERRERERLEAERLERERLEMVRRERELIEQQRLEAEQRERERREDELRERRRQEQERRDREMLEQAEHDAMERERQRRIQEKLEQERLENLRREQERLELERLEAERKERERAEAERRERELLEAQHRAKERRDLERLEEERRERERQEEERREKERRERERLEAIERERLRQIEEQRERERLAALEAAAAERRAQRALEDQRERERLELERRAEQIREMERREAEKRERDRTISRMEEERRLAELRDLERRNADLRDKERREAAEREARRRQEDRRSRDRLDLIAKEREERERWELERRRLLAEREAQEKKRKDLTSKETLERLTRKPYYSRENLASLEPEVTTKVERQVIERVDRTLWTSDGYVPSQYHYSSGITGGSGLPPPLDTSPTDDYGLNGYSRERMYNPRKPDDDDFFRGSSKRTSRYKAKMEKARKEFLHSDQPPTDPLSDRFRKSTEDLGSRRPEYRGPLLQKFHSGEFSSRPELDGYGYPRMGPSPYEKATETNLDDVHRSKSVLDYNNIRHSRKDLVENFDGDQQHNRSKSADYLMDRKTREETAPPENELRKTAEITEQLSEHELRFRKSVEKLSVPDWYRDYSSRRDGSPNRQPYAPLPPTTTTSETNRYEYSASRYGQPWSYTEAPPTSELRRAPSGSPVGGIAFPPGMFDKYKEEIEDMRRSRTSLHQIGLPQEHTKEVIIVDPNVSSDTTTFREEVRETISREEVNRIVTSGGKHLPGYTVSTIPSDWNLSRNRNSRVIEVADTFVGKPPENAEQFQRYGGRVTVEEVLDSIFQETKPSTVPIDPSLPQSDRHPSENVDGPGIYTTNYMLMDRVIQQPHLAETLLKKENLFVRCAHCNKARPIQEARIYYVSCKHCYTYYCNRQHRLRDWEKHRECCSFARINTLCKEVIMKVRRDARAQYAMSMVAREGYKNYGRGSVNIRLHSAHAAQQYLEHGWKVFANIDQRQLLFYYPIQILSDQRKEQSLITLCRKYNPSEKFILSVSLVADIEQCPETPPPEPYIQSQNAFDFRDGIQEPYHQMSPATDNIYGALVPTNV
uniref:MYND-type domain-containing protein n=1 Tax=Acrobeloides nanus TaxID=290746 RepID=A0A914D3Y2_9BILA